MARRFLFDAFVGGQVTTKQRQWLIDKLERESRTASEWIRAKIEEDIRREGLQEGADPDSHRLDRMRVEESETCEV
jgi:hypothetical protein